MFEVGGEYINRKGKYKVLEIAGNKMTVKYEDGSTSELNVAIQERIWQNILADRGSVDRQSKKKQPANVTKSNFYIRTISLATVKDTAISAVQEWLSLIQDSAPTIGQGDRFIFYAIEPACFFAVATTTKPPSKASQKIPKYFDDKEGKIFSLSLDWDASVAILEEGVDLNSIELESQPDFKKLLTQDGLFLSVSEDDFELLAELIAEHSEELEEEIEMEEEDVEIEEEL